MSDNEDEVQDSEDDLLGSNWWNTITQKRQSELEAMLVKWN
jgi:hypothetical protein